MNIETLAAIITVCTFLYAVLCKVFALFWPTIKSKIISIVKEIIDEIKGED